MAEIKEMRIEGVYPQRQAGFAMVRVKLPGAISAIEADALARMSEVYSSGVLHLTTRGSIELHYVPDGRVEDLLRSLRGAGLTSRGACGGAVRGVACGRADAESFPQLLEVAGRLHRRFTGNPRWEKFPKKFKIGVFSGCDDLRYLIQDAALVQAGDGFVFDVWCAG